MRGHRACGPSCPTRFHHVQGRRVDLAERQGSRIDQCCALPASPLCDERSFAALIDVCALEQIAIRWNHLIA